MGDRRQSPREANVRKITLLLIAFTFTAATAPAARAAQHRFGIGGHYWRALDDIDVDDLRVEEDGVAPYFTYQYAPEGIFRLELDLEYYEAGFGGSTDDAVSPLAFVLVELGLYGGLGVGVTISDGLSDNVSDPFWVARLGYDFAVLPRVHVDVNANYRANTFEGLEDYDSDSITLGAAVRFALGDR
jgi:hypothetical protein